LGRGGGGDVSLGVEEWEGGEGQVGAGRVEDGRLDHKSLFCLFVLYSFAVKIPIFRAVDLAGMNDECISS